MKKQSFEKYVNKQDTINDSLDEAWYNPLSWGAKKQPQTPQKPQTPQVGGKDSGTDLSVPKDIGNAIQSNKEVALGKIEKLKPMVVKWIEDNITKAYRSIVGQKGWQEFCTQNGIKDAFMKRVAFDLMATSESYTTTAKQQMEQFAKQLTALVKRKNYDSQGGRALRTMPQQGAKSSVTSGPAAAPMQKPLSNQDASDIGNAYGRSMGVQQQMAKAQMR